MLDQAHQILAFGHSLVYRCETAYDVTGDDLVSDAAEQGMISHPEYFVDQLYGNRSVRIGDDLIEDALGVTHGPLCSLCDGHERTVIHLDLLLFGNSAQGSGDVGKSDGAKLEVLTARQDGRDYLVALSG